ncbi:MAG: exopolyphosphatase [Elusimicrobia bacterium]|nr:exopolyphosphatase [Elusimicrobiota bacterium]
MSGAPSRGGRLVTKADFDGLVCGVLLRELGEISTAAFAHPKAVESGAFAIAESDVIAGLPYRPEPRLAFDHVPRAARGARKNLIVDRRARSTSRVVHRHYQGRFTHDYRELLDAVDKIGAADLTPDEILYPTGWTLFDFLIDDRTGLERRARFRRTRDELLGGMIEHGTELEISHLLKRRDVEERLELYFGCVQDHKAQIMRCSTVVRNLVVTDLRGETVLHPGNRFVTYALFPECNAALEVSRAEDGRSIDFAAGKSIFDRTFTMDVGRVMRKLGGEGHASAGSCRAEPERAEETLRALVSELSYGTLRNLFSGYFNYY